MKRAITAIAVAIVLIVGGWWIIVPPASAHATDTYSAQACLGTANPGVLVTHAHFTGWEPGVVYASCIGRNNQPDPDIVCTWAAALVEFPGGPVPYRMSSDSCAPIHQ